MKAKLHGLLLGILAALAGGTALAIEPVSEELPAFKRALPAHYFACRADNECVMVQGWCATFAINKEHLSAYKKMPPDPEGKDADQCPPGWLPPKPQPVCEQKQCSIK